jgi:hypothetical protein
MGNCTGVFGACVGEDPQAIRKVDKDKMQLALAANNDMMLQDGNSMLKADYPGSANQGLSSSTLVGKSNNNQYGSGGSSSN